MKLCQIPPDTQHKDVFFHPAFLFYTQIAAVLLKNVKESLLVRFSNDTVLLFLLLSPASDHGRAFPAFVSWCDKNPPHLSVSKTTEPIIDFGKNSNKSVVSVICGKRLRLCTEQSLTSNFIHLLIHWTVSKRQNLPERHCESLFQNNWCAT